MVTQLDNHVLLPHQPNWHSPVVVQRQWQTAVDRSVAGGEERLGMRPRPRLQLTFSLLPFGIAEQARLLARLRAAVKCGYAAVPHWGRGIAVVSASGRTITLASDAWRYSGEDDWILIRVPDFATPEAYETAKLTAVSGSTLSLYANLTGTYGPGAVVWPLVFGHLVCSGLDHNSNWHAGVQVTLREFRPKQPPPTWDDVCFINPWGGCESWNNFADTAWTPDPDLAGHALGGLTYDCLYDWTAFCTAYGLVETWGGLADFDYSGGSTQRVATAESWNLPAGWAGDWLMYSMAALGAYDTFANLADGSVPSSWAGELNLLSGDEEGFITPSWTATDYKPPSITLSGTPGSQLRNDFAGLVGVFFTTDATARQVTRLGRWKVSGNSGSHALRIHRASDKVEMASVSVNLSSGSAGAYVWADLASPVLLSANTKYYLTSEEVVSGDQWYNSPGTNYTGTGCSSFGAVYRSGGTWGEASANGTGYVPVGMQ